MTATAFENADLLRRVARQDVEPIASQTALAAELGRDHSNLRRTFKSLADDGVLAMEPGKVPTLTDLGRQTLRGINIAQGFDAANDDTPAPTRWPMDKLRPNSANRPVHPDTIADMAAQIVAAGDILQPLLLSPPDANGVRMILAGERRWRGAMLLAAQTDLSGLGIIDGLPFVEREVSEVEALKIIIIENSAREDMTPLEDARQLLKLAEASGWSGAELARQTGRSLGGDRNKEKDVTDKLRIAREATPEQLADYERTGSWDALRNAVFGRATAPDPNLAVYRAAVLASLTKTYGVSVLPEEGPVPTTIEKCFRRGDPVPDCVAEIAQLKDLRPLSGDPWLAGGWAVIDPGAFAKRATSVGNTVIAPTRHQIPGADAAPLLTVYSRSERRYAGNGDDQRMEDVTLYRVRVTATLPDGREIESSRIAGAVSRTAALQLATEDLVYEAGADKALIGPVAAWLDAMSGEHFVGGKDFYNSARAGEARRNHGWELRQSNSGGGSVRPTPVEPETEAPALPGTETDGETPLSTRAVLALVELAHKVRAAPRDALSGERHDPENVEDIGVPQLAASVGKFWLDGTWNDLLTRHLVRGVTLPGGVPPLATLTDRGMSAIDTAGYAFPLDIDDIGDAQVAAGLIARDGYATDWIANEVAAAPAPAEVAEADDQPDLIDHWDRDPAAVAADERLLAEVEAFFEIRTDIDEDAARALMKRLAIEGPFTEDGDAGIVGLVDGVTASFGLIDPEHQMPPERKRAVGLLVAWAMEVVFGETR